MEDTLRTYIRNNKIKQIWLANKAGLSKAFICEWLNGKCGASATSIEFICKALDIRIVLTKLVDMRGLPCTYEQTAK